MTDFDWIEFPHCKAVFKSLTMIIKLHLAAFV